MRFHPEQSRLLSSLARFRIAVAGRSIGKTELAKRYLVRALRRPHPTCTSPLYFAAGPTFNQVKRIWWKDVKALIPPEWVADISETELVIRTIYDSELHLIGLDQPARAEGSQFCGGVVDESSNVRPDAWSISIRPTLSAYQAWCWRIGVPKRKGPGARQFRQAFDDAPDKPGSDAFWWKSSDILTPAEIADAKADLSLDDYLEQYEAKWLDSEGVLFTGFSPTETVVPCNYDPTCPIYVGLDFNVTPMAWVLGHWAQGRLRIFDELYLNNTNTMRTLDLLWQRYAGHKAGWVFTGDATSKARKTSASKSDYLQIHDDPRFQRAGRKLYIPASNPPRVDKAAGTNRLLCNAAGVRSLFLDPRCTHIIDDLRLQDSVTPKESGVGHASDALGYLIWHLFPMRATGEHGQGRVIIHKNGT